MVNIAREIEAAHGRAAEVERRLLAIEQAQVPISGNTQVEIGQLRIKAVETERLIRILQDLRDLDADGYRRGRQDCARHLRTELGLDRPGSSSLLALLRTIADRWDA